LHEIVSPALARGKVFMAKTACPNSLETRARAFYRDALRTVTRARVPFLVGGAYAFERYTGIARHTKDLDLFVRPADCERVLALFVAKGDFVDLRFPHWLGKVYRGDHFIDVIFSSGNAVAEVDDRWFAHARKGTVLGVRTRLCPPEEMIWSKAYVMERERYDGADVAHLLRACAADLDWRRLLERFAEDWRLLLAYLVLFGYIYPAERALIPARVMNGLLQRLENEQKVQAPRERVCRGTLLSREQFLPDIRRWKYKDPRLAPSGKMSSQAIAHWTAAITSDQVSQ
jgi:hypothetical protein